jgi:hypothetical protein
MKMMGYTGGGLGATGEGRLEPVQVGRLEENEGVSLELMMELWFLILK